MSTLDDYINGLEGKEDIDPLEVARNMLELHNAEITTRSAKIDEQMALIADRDKAIADRDAEINQWKVKNYDLTLMIPAGVNDSHVETPPGADDRGIDAATISIDDLFVK